jgi:hypothetical protein
VRGRKRRIDFALTLEIMISNVVSRRDGKEVDGTQTPFATASGPTFAFHLGEEDSGGLIADETGFLKKGGSP